MSSGKEAWREQLVSMRSALMRIAMARLRDTDLACEAVAAVMLAALERPPQFDEPSRIKAWLIGTLKYKVVDVLRQRASTRVHVGLDLDMHDSGITAEAATTDVDPGPEQRLVDQHFLEALNSALSRLPELHRRAFISREVLGEESAVTCTALGISSSHLGVCLHRARARLRQILMVHAA